MTDQLMPNAAPAARARQLLHTAAEARRQLEESVRELVAMRAWKVLGYANFSEMWETENGFKCPTHAQVIAVQALASNVPDGHTHMAMGSMVGLNRFTVGSILSQLRSGVDSQDVSKSTNAGYGRTARTRQKPRRLGAAPDDYVGEGFALPRREADEIAEIAREADMPKAEIYRQAVAEYLARHRASRPMFSGVAS